jgi:hypothetical protein
VFVSVPCPTRHHRGIRERAWRHELHGHYNVALAGFPKRYPRDLPANATHHPHSAMWITRTEVRMLWAAQFPSPIACCNSENHSSQTRYLPNEREDQAAQDQFSWVHAKKRGSVNACEECMRDT